MPKSWKIALTLALLSAPACAEGNYAELRTAALTSAAQVIKVLDAHPELKTEEHKGIPALDAALMEAIYSRRGKPTADPDVMKTLLEHGANPDGVNTAGSTHLEFAVYFCDTRGAELLLSKGAHVNAFDSSGVDALEYAGVAASEKNANPTRILEITTLLLDKGARPDHKDGNGRTDLETALTLQDKDPDNKTLKAYVELLKSRLPKEPADKGH